MSLLTLLPGTICASVQKARKFRAAWRHARSAHPSQKVYRQRSGPPPRVRAVSPMPASPWRESSGTESSSAGAPSGGIPAAKSERPCSLPHTRGRLFLAKAVEPHDLTATLRLVGVRVRLRLRRFRIGGDGHRHAGLRRGLVLRRRARRVTARRSALVRLPGLLGFGVRHFFELQAKLHRRIEEAFHRREGTANRSGTPPKDTPTSKPLSFTTRSQNWCCRTTVISVGYCASMRGDRRTPSARVSKEM